MNEDEYLLKNLWRSSLSLSLIILFTNVQNKKKYIYKSTIGKGKQ